MAELALDKGIVATELEANFFVIKLELNAMRMLATRAFFISLKFEKNIDYDPLADLY